jgi:hypothetical protein
MLVQCTIAVRFQLPWTGLARARSLLLDQHDLVHGGTAKQ